MSTKTIRRPFAPWYHEREVALFEEESCSGWHLIRRTRSKMEFEYDPGIRYRYAMDGIAGGRINAATAVVGSALGIKPVLHVDEEGHLINMIKARGRKKSLLALRDILAERITRPEGNVLISHGDCYEDARFLGDEILKICPKANVIINMIGPIVGGHSGPGTVAMFFIGEGR